MGISVQLAELLSNSAKVSDPTAAISTIQIVPFIVVTSALTPLSSFPIYVAITLFDIFAGDRLTFLGEAFQPRKRKTR